MAHYTDALIENYNAKPLTEASSYSTMEKLRLWLTGQRKENISACGDTKLLDFADTLYKLMKQDLRWWQSNMVNSSVQQCWLTMRDIITSRGLKSSVGEDICNINLADVAKNFRLNQALFRPEVFKSVQKSVDKKSATNFLYDCAYGSLSATKTVSFGWSTFLFDEFWLDLRLCGIIIAMMMNSHEVVDGIIKDITTRSETHFCADTRTTPVFHSITKDIVKSLITQITSEKAVMAYCADQWNKFMFSPSSATESLTEDVEKHDKLNPKLWNDDNTLKQEVADKINAIVEDFLAGLEQDDIKLNVKDIRLVGSNCSYNYNENSDLDVHIVADVDDLHCPDNLYPLLYGAYRSIWNEAHDIKFYGIPVEIFVETTDVEKEPALDEAKQVSPLRSNGIYSVMNKQWIKEPVAADIPDVDKSAFDQMLGEWQAIVDTALSSTSSSEVQEAIDDLYQLRKSSIDEEGEYGLGNLVFKEIRNKGDLDKLRDLRTDLESQELSLEENMLSESQAQEIAQSYRSLSRLYGVDMEDLVYGKDGFMNACYPDGFPDFAGDVIFSEKYWTELEQWAKAERGIILKSAHEDGWEETMDESLMQLLK